MHIIPLGHEFDRAVKPFEEFPVNRVHLLAITESSKYSREMLDKQKYFLDAVKNRLVDMGVEVRVRNVDTFDVPEVMKHISQIILTEKSENNIVYVNMSASGRLTSVAATLAAMAHNVRVYYVVADRYPKDEEEELKHGLSICEKLKVVELENFQLQLPDKMALRILVKLCSMERGMKTKEILDLLRESRAEGFEKDYAKLMPEERRQTQQRYLIKLNKGILGKLEKGEYIEREMVGRYNTIKITDSGRYAAHISGLMEA